MQYRQLGNTGVTISALGFGCMRLKEIEQPDGTFVVDQEHTNAMLRRAYELGVNYFDTAYYYCHSGSEAAVGEALKEIRDKVYVSTKCPMELVKKPEEFRRTLETSLERLGMEYVDFYHFWSINQKVFDEKIVPLGLLEEAEKLKAEGKIRHISFSFHDKPEALKHIIDNAPQMETMLVQYNLLDRANEEMIQYAKDKGLGVFIMGPVGGGRLAAPTELVQKLGAENLNTYELALRFVLGNPSVSCALSGMQSVEMVEKNAAVASMESPMTEKEWREVSQSLENLQKFSELYCTGCGYCQPCPKEINIPRLFQAYTHHNVYGLSETAKKMYNGYVNNEKKPGATSKDCINCGFCERKCPQKLEIRNLLKKVEGVLGTL